MEQAPPRIGGGMTLGGGHRLRLVGELLGEELEVGGDVHADLLVCL